MRYNVTIQELLERTVQVEANSQEDAEYAVHSLYRSCDIVLSADDYVDTNFKVSEAEPYYVSPNHDFTVIKTASHCSVGEVMRQAQNQVHGFLILSVAVVQQALRQISLTGDISAWN